jgi:uncharacterized protein YkwD
MARALCRFLVLVGALVAAAAFPAAGQAKLLALSKLELPPAVTVGQSALTASIVLERCHGGSGPGCLGREISLTPSCSLTVAGRCGPAGAEAGVLAFSRATSGTCDRTFDVSAPDPVTGEIAIEPGIGNVLVPGPFDTCRIDLEFAVLRMPASDADSALAGVQTRQVAVAVGGPNDDPADGHVVSATMTVAPAAGVLRTLAARGVVLGSGALTARATFSGSTAPTGRQVEFRLYGPDDPTCASAIFTASATFDAAGQATSAPFTPMRAGVYRWRAFDGTAGSACDDPDAAVLVAAPATPPPAPSGAAIGTFPPATAGAAATAGSSEDGLEIVGAAFDRAPRVGQLVFLEVNARDPKRPISGAQVRFGEARGLSGISACTPGLGARAGTLQLRLPYTFHTAGRHTVTITALSGGCTSARTRATETLSVDVAPAAASRAASAAARPGARPGSAGGSCAGAADVPKNTASSREKVATAVLCLVNAERAKHGLKKLARSKVLAQAATNHSKDMIKRRYFDHVGPRGPAFAARLRRVRYRGGAAENIGYGADFSAQLIVRAWMNSPGHRANILTGKMRFGGLGVVVDMPVSPRNPGATYTMVFGSKQR